MSTDYDECLERSHDCNEQANCTNAYGSYNCICRQGYEGDGFSCSDIDECASGTDDCLGEDLCENLQGSYKCMCKDGVLRNTETGECEGNMILPILV